ncbi:MAG: Pyridoxal 4-dehydrogenase [Chloroflexi bacterium ADurb.Bin325]|nr:MAG: Pyridoxal 4-dehydrogenase [Chloroflexi bacterium ADurb.Bin325]
MSDPRSLVRRPIGRTGLTVPALSFGTAPLGTLSYLNSVDSDAQAVETIRHAFEAGVALFDTAPSYGEGTSERRLGLALAGLPRERFVLETKVVSRMARVQPDYSRDGVLRSLEGSLERLRLDRIDIALIHDPETHYREALDIVYPVLAELRDQGALRAIGVGMMNRWRTLMAFARNADFDCLLLAGRYHLLEQEALPFLELCQQRGIAVLLGAVYATGILATGAIPGARYEYREASPEILERVRRIEAICAEHGVPLSAAALQFPLGHPAVTSLVVGMQQPAEVDANLTALAHPIPAALWADLRAAGLLDANAPAPGDAPTA